MNTKRKPRRHAGAERLAAAAARAMVRVTGDLSAAPIPPDMTFRQWCETLARDRTDPTTGKVLRGLKVDGKPFSLADRPAMAWIYDQVPSTREAARGRRLVLMKCAQVGFTVFEMLAAIYLALKFEPLTVGFFLPSMSPARGKSAERFLPIMRTIPEAYELLTAPDPAALQPQRSEGNVLLRRMRASLFHFLWTSGRTSTESYPMDVLCFDEVQEMSVADIEKVLERVSGSTVKLALLGSTANHPEGDIDYFYQRGDRWRFHTHCPGCGSAEPLDEYFPACVGYDANFPNPDTGELGAYRYRCRTGHWINDAQIGEWRPTNPEADPKTISIHFHQMISPTVTPGEIRYYGASGGSGIRGSGPPMRGVGP